MLISECKWENDDREGTAYLDVSLLGDRRDRVNTRLFVDDVVCHIRTRGQLDHGGPQPERSRDGSSGRPGLSSPDRRVDRGRPEECRSAACGSERLLELCGCVRG